MNKKLEESLGRAVKAHSMFQTQIRYRNVYMFTENSIVVPQNMLYEIEPDPKKWDYRKSHPKGWWAHVMYKGTKFECWLSDEAHLDVGGYGLQ